MCESQQIYEPNYRYVVLQKSHHSIHVHIYVSIATTTTTTINSRNYYIIVRTTEQAHETTRHHHHARAITYHTTQTVSERVTTTNKTTISHAPTQVTRNKRVISTITPSSTLIQSSMQAESEEKKSHPTTLHVNTYSAHSEKKQQHHAKIDTHTTTYTKSTSSTGQIMTTLHVTSNPYMQHSPTPQTTPISTYTESYVNIPYTIRKRLIQKLQHRQETLIMKTLRSIRRTYELLGRVNDRYNEF